MTGSTPPLLSIQNLVKHFPVSRAGLSGKGAGATVKAVDGIDFSIAKGETLGLVGESGCGKSTTGRLILRLIEPTDGAVLHQGKDIVGLPAGELRAMRHSMQMIFQDPYGSLNPRLSVGAIIAEAFKIHRIGSRAQRFGRVAELLDLVGLPRSAVNRFPHEFSGGQRQRIGIARSLALKPDLLVCDEVVSALDVSVQAQIVNLLHDLQKELELTYLFISHNLAVVRHISDRIAVMYLGRIVEIAKSEEIFSSPAHPYTRALISAVPPSHPDAPRHRYLLKGEILGLPSNDQGCRFAPRCPHAEDRCRKIDPLLTELDNGRQVACHLAVDGTLFESRAALE